MNTLALSVLLAAAAVVPCAQPVAAEPDASPEGNQEVPDLRKQLHEMQQDFKKLREDYEKRIDSLQARLDKLTAEQPPAPDVERQALRQEIESLLAEEEEPVTRVFRGAERYLSELNPEISVTGDFVGNYNVDVRSCVW